MDINTVGETSSSQEVTKEYLNEIKGNNSFFNTTGGKYLKTFGLLGVSTALTTVLPTVHSFATGIGLGLLENYWLEGLLKGKNPSMFVNDVSKVVENRSNTHLPQ